MKNLKKIITAFLILTLVLTSVPTVAYAADSRPTTEKPIELAPLYIDGRNTLMDETKLRMKSIKRFKRILIPRLTTYQLLRV